MTVHVYQCSGLFRPGDFNHSTERTPSLPGNESNEIEHQGLVVTGSPWNDWSPARVRAANAEHRAWQLAARDARAKESAAAAEAASNFEEPEPGATTHDIRVYTRLKNGQYKYWGVRDDDMTIEEFWEEKDPGNSRDQDETQDHPINPPPAQNGSLSRGPSPHNSASPRSERSQKTPHVNPQFKVKKPSTVRPPSNKSTRKSLATMLDAGHSGLREQARDVTESTLKGRRSGAHLAIVESPDAQAIEPRKRSDAAKHDPAHAPRKSAGRGRPRKVQHVVVETAHRSADPPPSSAAKRKRGRPSKLQPSPKSSGKRSRPAAENKAKITKPKQKTKRCSPPSTHKMCTRARGPVERSHLA